MIGRLFSALPVRPRTAIALALLAVVGVVVLIGKLMGGESPQSFPDGSSQISTVDPTDGERQRSQP